MSVNVMTSSAEYLRRFLIDNQLALIEDIQGVSEQAIIALEASVGHTLPDEYKSFLRIMGRKAGIFLSGEYIYEDRLPLLKSYSQEFSQRSFSHSPSPRFVFWAYLRDDFAYFPLNDIDNPKVYFWSSGQDSIIQRQGGIEFSSIWDFLLNEAKSWAETRKGYPPYWLDDDEDDDEDEEGDW